MDMILIPRGTLSIKKTSSEPVALMPVRLEAVDADSSKSLAPSPHGTGGSFLCHSDTSAESRMTERVSAGPAR